MVMEPLFAVTIFALLAIKCSVLGVVVGFWGMV